MENHKQVPLVRYPDGTPSVLRPRTDYSKLHFYQKSDVLVQLTKSFCERFLPKWGDRTVDQMVQASRSIKQNLAEELTDGQTSFEVEIKLLGIARGSNQELLEDYRTTSSIKDCPSGRKGGQTDSTACTASVWSTVTNPPTTDIIRPGRTRRWPIVPFVSATWSIKPFVPLSKSGTMSLSRRAASENI